MTTCALCNGPLEAGRVDHIVAVGDEQVSVSVAADICHACNESFVDDAALKLAEAKVAVAIIQSGEPNGARFRFLRHFLGLTAKSLGELLKIDPSTISRWEREHRDRTPDRLAWFALTTLVRDHIHGRDEGRDILRAMEQPRPLTVPRDSSAPLALAR
jgi:YgiT-type zinc finger domain-containing protein